MILLLCLVVPGGPFKAEGKRIGLVISNLPPHGSAAYRAIRTRAGKASGQVLPLTKSEMWSLPRHNEQAVMSAARRYGAGVDELDENWNDVLRPLPVAVKINEQQEAMVKALSASAATMGIGIVAAPAPALVEYALTKDAAEGPAKIVLHLNDATRLTLTRTSVDIKPDMCIWRGVVDGTDMPATIMWWPRGKMAGVIQHRRRMYSIRHIGGEVHAIIETSEDLMPRDHVPPPPPSSKDDAKGR